MHRPASPSRGAQLARALGEVLVTLGVLVLLYSAYLLWWTNLEADDRAGAEVQRLREAWQRPGSAGASPAGPGAAPRSGTGASTPPPAPSGEPSGAESGAGSGAGSGAASSGPGFALLFLPRLGHEWVQPVVESGDGGTSIPSSALAMGVVHYPRTALPGEQGNFAVAGHRATHGEPFRDLDRLRAGDAVVVQTRESWLTYRVTGSEIVAPTRTDVLAPVPGRPGAPADRPRMTLTTCHPRWSSEFRLIVYAELASQAPAAAGPPAALEE